MNFLFYDMGSYTYQDFAYFLQKSGHTVKTVYYHFPDKFQDEFFTDRLKKYLLADRYDAVISVNFFPLVALICQQMHIKYVSWCYDSPLEERLQEYFAFDTNYIFLFDRIEAESYNAMGYEQVYHLPLAVSTKRIDSLLQSGKRLSYSPDISFVGKIYDSPLSVLMQTVPPQIQGYVEGILQAQLRIYGYYFIDELLSDDLLAEINASFKNLGQTSVQLSRRGLSYAIASQITQLERSFLLEQLAELFDTHVYTFENSLSGNRLKIHTPVKYYDEMPLIFHHSRLSLNPTLKSIASGIPLRALDILGARGVLFSNFQPELAEYFEDGTDVIMYSSMEDAVSKADFYLKNTALCEKIAQSGYEKVKEYFTYPQRIETMLTIAGLH